MNMKKSLMLIAMALMAVSADAQTIAPTLVSEIDWTQRSDYYSNMWYSPDYCTVTVTKGEGLIIVSNPPSGADYWDSQVPVIGHIPSLTEGGNYVVKITIDSSVSGEGCFDLSNGNDVTQRCEIGIRKGIKEYTIVFQDYTKPCTDAMLFFQCGKLPGRFVVKKVQVFDLRLEGDLNHDGKINVTDITELANIIMKNGSEEEGKEDLHISFKESEFEFGYDEVATLPFTHDGDLSKLDASQFECTNGMWGYAVNVGEGKGDVTGLMFEPGTTYQITLTYKGNQYYKPTTVTVSAQYKPTRKDLHISILENEITMGYDEYATIPFIHDGVSGKLDESLFECTNGSWGYSVNLENDRGYIWGDMSDGGETYNLTLTFKGNQYYNPTTVTFPVTYIPKKYDLQIDFIESGIYNKDEIVTIPFTYDGPAIVGGIDASLFEASHQDAGLDVTLKSGKKRGIITGLMSEPGAVYNVELKFKGNKCYNPTQKNIQITYYPQY